MSFFGGVHSNCELGALNSAAPHMDHGLTTARTGPSRSETEAAQGYDGCNRCLTLGRSRK
jgi:hypothetical protein